jgi:hypothetical protein
MTKTERNYLAASDRSLAFLERNLLAPGFRQAGHDDVAYFFKAPAAFLAAGRTERARDAWRLAAPYLARGGAGSANQAYATQYAAYPWFWMARAAAGLGDGEALRAAGRSLDAYVHPTLDAATVKAPYAAGGRNTVDFFMTAALGQVRLLTGDAEPAAAMGDTLLRFIHAQPAGATRFLLRMDDAGVLFTAPPDGEPEVFYQVAQGAGDQLFFMLGLPMIHLVQLHRRTGDPRHLDGAERLLAFAAACGDPLYTSRMAHKVARGAAMLAAHTGSDDARAMALGIMDHLASLQLPSGSFGPEEKSMDAYDQTAELALWLREVHQDLESLRER